MKNNRSPKRHGGDRPQDRRLIAERAEALFQHGADAHRAGNLDQARQAYRKVLSVQPRHANARHLLGFAEFQTSHFAAAIEHLEQAVAICPDKGEFQNNLALAYLAVGAIEPASRHATRARELGHTDGHGFQHVGWEHLRQKRLEWAESAFRLALIVQPDAAEPYNDLGVLLADQRRWDEAVHCYRQAVSRCPTHVESWTNLGNALRDQRQTAEAISCYERALQLDPRFAPAHNNLGVALTLEGQVLESIECYQRALHWQPQFVEALNNRGNAYRELGRIAAAVDDYRQALRLQPGSAEILCNLGAGLRDLDQIPEAIACFRKAIVLQPASVKIHHHLAAALADAGHFDAAAGCWQHLVRLEPQQPLWRLCRATLCPTVFHSRTHMESVSQMLIDEIDSVRQTGFELQLSQFTELAAPFPFKWQFFEGDLRPVKEAYAELFRHRLATYQFARWIDSWRGPGLRPRIGMVVTDGHEGVFLKSLRGIMERLAARWDLVIFCSQKGAHVIRSVNQQDALRVVPLPTRFDHQAQAIADARCDLLYYWEVGTDAKNYFLPFLRLAPVQVTSWGVQVTSGITSLDAYLSSELVELPEAQDHYTERLWLARTLLTYRRRMQLPPSPLRRDHFPVPADAHWYVCAQQTGKFHIDFDPLLGGILRSDPQGVVIATGDRFGHNVDQLRRRFQITIPDVESRIHFLPRQDQAEYLSLLQLADVLLDPPHFGGVNSTYDGLSAGKPIVALPSAYHRGRYTLGCYRKMGFLDCVAANAEQYVDLAVRLGVDREYRHELSNRLVAASHALFEDSAAVTEHERLFEELIQRRLAL